MRSETLPKRPREHGTGRQPCRNKGCKWRSVAGLHKGEGRCPYHYTVWHWGTAWADKMFQAEVDNAE